MEEAIPSHWGEAWQVLSAAGAGASGLAVWGWRNRKQIIARLRSIKQMAVAPLAILEQLEKQAERDEAAAKRDEAAAKDRKEFSARLDKQDVVLAKLLAEVTPNGGSSLKDLVQSAKDLALATHQMTVVSEGRVRLLQSMACACIFECDAKTGACIWANDGLCTLFDLTPAEMLGWGWMAAVAYEEREGVKHAWEASVAGGYPYSWEYTIVSKAGVKTRVIAKAVELRDKDGKSLLFQGTVERVK